MSKSNIVEETQSQRFCFISTQNWFLFFKQTNGGEIHNGEDQKEFKKEKEF